MRVFGGFFYDVFPLSKFNMANPPSVNGKAASANAVAYILVSLMYYTKVQLVKPNHRTRTRFQIYKYLGKSSDELTCWLTLTVS